MLAGPAVVTKGKNARDDAGEGKLACGARQADADLQPSFRPGLAQEFEGSALAKLEEPAQLHGEHLVARDRDLASGEELHAVRLGVVM